MSGIWLGLQLGHVVVVVVVVVDPAEPRLETGRPMLQLHPSIHPVAAVPFPVPLLRNCQHRRRLET